jgi:predicted porin
MKTLICQGIAATLLSASGLACAQSSVTVSGVIDTGVTHVTNTGNGSQATNALSDSILGVSNVGFSGKEDLGGGMTAIFNLQEGFNVSDGRESATNQLFSRNSYVGVQSTVGQFTAGKQWNFNDDWLVGSVFKGGYNSGAVFKFSEFDAISEIYNNTLKYVSPTFGGFQAGAMYGFGEAAGSNKTGQMYNVGLKYVQGPVLVAITYDQEQGGVATGALPGSPDTKYKLTTLGGSYDFGTVKARLGAAAADISGTGGSFQSIPSISTRKAYVVEAGMDYAFTPAFTGSADVIYRKNTTFDNNSKVYRLLGIYSLSKRTALVFNVARLNNDDGASEALVNTDSTAVGGGFVNQNQTSIAMGIRHTF